LRFTFASRSICFGFGGFEEVCESTLCFGAQGHIQKDCPTRTAKAEAAPAPAPAAEAPAPTPEAVAYEPLWMWILRRLRGRWSALTIDDSSALHWQFSIKQDPSLLAS
jgi:hypothetical protein